MKKIITIISLLSLIAASAYAMDVKLGWDYNPPTELVDKYVIEAAKGTNGVFQPIVTSLSSTNAAWIRGLTVGTWKFRVVAVNAAGSAPPSNVATLSATNSPTATKNVLVLEVK